MKHGTPLLLLVLLGACASSPDPQPEPAPAAEEPAFFALDPEAEAVPAVADPEASAALAVFRDPSFRRRVSESFLSETEVEPGVTLVERERMEEVMGLLGQEKVGKAIAELEEAREETGGAVFDVALGNLRFQRDELEPAVEAYRRAVETFPKFRRAWRMLGISLVRLERPEEARPALVRVLELGGGDALVYGLLGHSHATLGDPVSAESAYRMAVLLDPETLDWRLGLARAFFDQRRFPDAVALLDVLIEDRPERADLWLLQANAFIGMGEPAKAAQNYELADRLGGSTAASLANLADVYVNEELFDLAVDAYLRSLELDPEVGTERAVRAARVVTARGAFGETLRLVEGIEALRGDALSDVERKALLQLRARVALARGAGDEEARVLEEIVALDPLDGEALILLGQHASRADDPERAAFYYERAAALEGFEADAKVRHAQLLVSQGRYREALPLLRRAQDLDPRDNVADYLDQVERVAQGR